MRSNLLLGASRYLYISVKPSSFSRLKSIMPRPLLGLLLLILLAIFAWAEDWPRWRGVRGDGTWQGPKLPEQWPVKGPKKKWSRPIGGGYAGIAVVGSRVFTMDRVAPPANTPDADGTERILCLDAETGEPRWTHSYPVRYGDLGGYGNGPRAMPTIHEGKVYTFGAVGHVHCLDAATGKVIWTRDMVKECQAKVPMWGYASSPVIDGDRVLIHAGAEPDGCLVALDRHTGKELWRSGTDPAGYCTPVLIDAPSGRQIILWTPEHIHGLDAATGKPLWKVPYKITYGVSIATPIYQEGLVFISGYWDGSKTIQLGDKPTDMKLVHEDRRLCGLMAQPLYRDGYVYLLDKKSGLVCVELKTGKRLWEDHRLTPPGRNPHASIVWLGDGDRILLLNSTGELILARINPSGYQEQSRKKILSQEVWSHPGFAGNYIYVHSDGAEQAVRSGPHEIACFVLTE
jgi:outer membrane protein assembly factor BamB